MMKLFNEEARLAQVFRVRETRPSNRETVDVEVVATFAAYYDAETRVLLLERDHSMWEQHRHGDEPARRLDGHRTLTLPRGDAARLMLTVGTLTDAVRMTALAADAWYRDVAKAYGMAVPAWDTVPLA
jgi:hypothetical protein